MWQAIGGIVKMGLGAVQASAGMAGLAGLKRPEYKIPKERQMALGLAKKEYGDPYMPGQGMLQDRLDMQAQNAYTQASIAGNPLASIAGIQANQQAAQQNLGMQAAQYQRQDLQSLYGQLDKMTEEQKLKFQVNDFAEYAMKSQRFENMVGAGTKNAFGGMDETFGAMDAYMGNSGMSGTGTDTAGDTSDTWAKWNKSEDDGSPVTSEEDQEWMDEFNRKSGKPGYRKKDQWKKGRANKKKWLNEQMGY